MLDLHEGSATKAIQFGRGMNEAYACLVLWWKVAEELITFRLFTNRSGYLLRLIGLIKGLNWGVDYDTRRSGQRHSVGLHTTFISSSAAKMVINLMYTIVKQPWKVYWYRRGGTTDRNISPFFRKHKVPWILMRSRWHWPAYTYVSNFQRQKHNLKTFFWTLWKMFLSKCDRKTQLGVKVRNTHTVINFLFESLHRSELYCMTYSYQFYNPPF